MKKMIMMSLACLGLAGEPLWAASPDDLRIESPWARASIGQIPNGVAYFTVINSGSTGDRLVAVRTPVAKHASLHTHRMEGGMMRMEAVPAIDVDAGATVRIAHGGLHIMLMGLHEPLREGERFPLTLQFDDAGPIDIEVTILGAASMGPDSEAMDGKMPMHGNKKVH